MGQREAGMPTKVELKTKVVLEFVVMWMDLESVIQSEVRKRKSNIIYWHMHAAAAKSLQSCPTLRPHAQQPTRPLCPQDSPG